MISVLWVEAKDGANSLQCTRQSPRQRTIRPKIPIELMPRSIVPAEKTINLSMDKKTAASNQGNGKMERGDQIERERPGGIATEAEDPAARIRSRVERIACAKDVRQEGARQAWAAGRRTAWLELGTWATQQGESSSSQRGACF